MAYAEVNGRRVAYREAGEGPAVVFLHAGLMDARMWDLQLPVFAGRFRAIAFDAPGFGESEPPAGPYDLPDVLGGLLDALAVERAALVGCSMGGAAAVDFALASPERVWALVAVASGLSGFRFKANSDEQEARAEAAWEARDLETLADLWLEVWAPAGADETLRRIAHENAKVFALPDDVPRERPAVDRLGELRVPTLVVAGDRDVQGIQEICRKLATEVAGARLEAFEGADHLPSYRQPERFNRLVLEFLSAQV